jgi:hypothetical protein
MHLCLFTLTPFYLSGRDYKHHKPNNPFYSIVIIFELYKYKIINVLLILAADSDVMVSMQ